MIILLFCVIVSIFVFQEKKLDRVRIKDNLMNIFNKEQQQKASFILDNPCARLSGLLSSEIKDLAVAWCYYSGKIEGNTYTYV